MERRLLGKKDVLILTNTKSRTRNTMDDGANPSDLPLVDSEVGATRSFQSLSIQNINGDGRLEALGLDKSVNNTQRRLMNQRWTREYLTYRFGRAKAS